MIKEGLSWNYINRIWFEDYLCKQQTQKLISVSCSTPQNFLTDFFEGNFLGKLLFYCSNFFLPFPPRSVSCALSALCFPFVCSGQIHPFHFRATFLGLDSIPQFLFCTQKPPQFPWRTFPRSNNATPTTTATTTAPLFRPFSITFLRFSRGRQ